MPKFNMTRKYPYPADQVFAVASQVRAYDKFVPLVRGVQISDRKANADGTESFKAALTITYRKLNIRETVQADVTVDPKDMTITGVSSDGILSHLHSVWRVRSIADGGSEVEMDIDYAMKSKMMQVLVSGMFDLAMRKIANALGDRVAEVHGHASVTA